MNYAVLKNASLINYNTLRINSVAALLFFPFNNEGVKEIYQEFKSSKKIIIIGKGSNILFSKEYYDESYVFVNFKLMDGIRLTDKKVFIETGVTLSSLSWFALENNVRGYEFLEDVPGSLGGAIIMNAGTYEDNIGELVESITYYDISKEEIISEKVIPQNFGRRTSKWTNINVVILSCTLNTKPGNYIESLDKLLEIKKTRYLKQPRNYPNAGSVFKRPSYNGEDFYIWKLFNDLNLRGYKKNSAMISEKHPGFIVNLGGAKYVDIKYLLDLATEKVKSEYNIDLELEWKII